MFCCHVHLAIWNLRAMLCRIRVFFFVFLLASIIPSAQSISVSPRQEPSPTAHINGKEYNIEFILPALNEARRTTSINQMRERFDKQTALVMITKRLNETGASERLKKEASYAKKARIHLFHQADDAYDYLVIRDDYPGNMSVPLKFFHEWYLENRRMNAKKGLADLRDLIRQKLPKVAHGIGLINPNIYLWSVLIDQHFEKLVAIDWSPADDVHAGVEVHLKDDRQKLNNYIHDMDRVLPQRFSVGTLESVLKAVGKNLRHADGGPLDTVVLNQYLYTINLLSKTKQNTQFTYHISGGFILKKGNRAPALLKVILCGNRFEEAKIKKEIAYLTEVGLHLFTAADDVAFYIVTRNVRKEVPSLKPYHEWYLGDRSRNGDDDLKELRTNVEKQLVIYAEKGKLCYQDIHLLNIYVDKTLQKVRPVDWGPGDNRVWGVEEIISKGAMEECERFISKKVGEMFNRVALEEVLRNKK